MTTDSFENRILLHLNQCIGARTTWNNLKYSLEKELGYSVNPNLLHFKLKKLRDENKIKFIQVGDFTSYQSCCSFPS
jgi:uncharacterized protein (UPF0218 family)